MESMLYDEAFEWLETNRWSLLEDIPWDEIEHDKVTAEELEGLKVNVLAEFTALDATMMFLRDFHTDIDFSCFMSIWFYEEMKHFYTLKKYLSYYGVEVPQKRMEMLHQNLPPGGMVNTLTMHMLGEIKLSVWYTQGRKYHREPVLRKIYQLLSADELRHGKMYFKFMEKWIAKDRAVVGQMLRMARFLIKEEGGTPKHPVPQLVQGDDDFDFGKEMNHFLDAWGVIEVMPKAEAMGFRWLSQLSGYEITDMKTLSDAIRAERRNSVGASAGSQELLPALGVFG